MSSDKRVLEYGSKALGLIAIDGKSVAATNGNIMRLNRPHAAVIYFDIANGADDGTAGGLMTIEFDVYDEARANIIFVGELVADIPIHVDLQAAVLFGGGVSAAASDGTIHADADLLSIFNNVRFRADVTVASNDTGTCVINAIAHVQE